MNSSTKAYETGRWPVAGMDRPDEVPTMGRSIAYRYSVEMQIVRGSVTPAAWPTKKSEDRFRPADLLGKPTEAKLARYVADYNFSLLPGGVNAHLGDGARCVYARIVDSHADSLATRVVAAWRSTTWQS